MRLIDADALKKHYAWWEDDRQKLFDSIVDSQPTVDAVPVVRCKDCVYKSEYGYCTLYINFHHLTEDMGYCSDAERREA